MPLPDGDRTHIVDELGRKPTTPEAALFENLWSEHCAYRSSRPLLSAFESEGDRVVIGPGDDAAAIDLGDDLVAVFGIESHNHPSYVDPYDGAATGVGGIVRDVMSMGAYPIGLVDSLYFGPFARDHSRYLFEGVVDGIADYGNAIGVPTVGGSVAFHEGYRGNPLVNVGCVGLTDADRLVTGAAQDVGNTLVLIGNDTGRDGLGGASFASEDLDEDAEVEDRPAVQVGDPYAEKRLIEANEDLLDAEVVVSARDLGAAGLGGASSEMAAQGEVGARIDLDAVHLREPGMTATEILLAESQERMLYEVDPDDVDAVLAIADRYDLGASVVGEVTPDRFVCTFDGDTVVDLPAAFVADGAPPAERAGATTGEPIVDEPAVDPDAALDTVLSSPNTVSRRWVYRQYDHEVGVRTAMRPGDDAAVLAIRENDTGLALAAGGEPNWTTVSPYRGAAAIGFETATNLAVKGADPIAAVDCLNGGNPETPAVFGGFRAIVNGLASMCESLSVPVVGGNVSLYNDSESGPIPPTPTVFMLGRSESYRPPTLQAVPEATVLLLGDPIPEGDDARLGGSELYAQFDGAGRFPELPDAPREHIDTLVEVAHHESTVATHDVATGGLVTALAEMVTAESGLDIVVDTDDPLGAAFHERPGRAIVQTTAPEAIRNLVGETMAVHEIGIGTNEAHLTASFGDVSIDRTYETIADKRALFEHTLE